MQGRRLSGALLLLLGLLPALPVQAIERIRVRVARVEHAASGVLLEDAAATLALRGGERATLTLDVADARLPAYIERETGRLSRLRLRCENPVLREPAFDCPRLVLSARAARLPPLAATLAAGWRSDTGTLAARGSAGPFAGANLAFDAVQDSGGWRLQVTLPDTELAPLRELAAPWLALPGGIALSGKVAAEASARGIGAHVEAATLDLRVAGVGLQDESATLVAEQLGAALHAELAQAGSTQALQVSLAARQGQLLAGPALFDFGAYPLTASAGALRAGTTLTIERLEGLQQGLARFTGSAVVDLAARRLRDAKLDVDDVALPAAYASFLQIPLATTSFGQLATTGSASASVTVTAARIVSVDVTLDGAGLRDDAHALRLEGLRGTVRWRDGSSGPPPPSFVEWSSGRGFGVEIGPARVDFATAGRGFALARPARLPVFDGAVRVNRLALDGLGSRSPQGEFDADVEPVSMERISAALGLPTLQGQLSGRLPGLTYRDGELALQGGLVADVFDGRVAVRNLRVRDPLGNWPRLQADVSAAGLDLGLITSAFRFGSITGRLDGEVRGLETFGWMPVAFDARFATPAGDRSRRRISQRAVQNLSSIGGGGGGVGTALQSGFLRFFDSFRYRRIGIACRLHDDVCEMSGAGPAKAGGFYILEGSGLPRVDIIGNGARVDWPQLVAQVRAALADAGTIVID